MSFAKYPRINLPINHSINELASGSALHDLRSEHHGRHELLYIPGHARILVVRHANSLEHKTVNQI
jgi:hypothetical protein